MRQRSSAIATFPADRIAQFTERLANDPNDLEALCGRGNALLFVPDRGQQALDDFQAALRQKPDDPELLAGVVRAQVGLNRKPEAIAAAKKLIDLSAQPNTAQIVAFHCQNLTNFLGNSRVSEYSDLSADLALRAVVLKPDDWIFHQSAGVACYRAGRYDAAVKELEQSLPKSTILYNDLLYLPMSQQRRGNTDKAADYLEQALKWHAESAQKIAPNLQNHVQSLFSEAEAVLKETPGKPAKP